MKTSFLIIVFFVCSLAGKSQLSGNVEFTRELGQNVTEVGLGASLQYVLSYDRVFLYGINAGVIFDVGENTTLRDYSIPVLGVARYYLLGAHSCCGGVYVEGNAGVRSIGSTVTVGEKTKRESYAVMELAGGLGYRGGMSYDYNFRIGTLLDGEDTGGYVGFRFGYTF